MEFFYLFIFSRLKKNKKIEKKAKDKQKALDIVEDENVEHLEIKVVATIGSYKDVEFTIVKNPEVGLDYYSDNLIVNDYLMRADVTADDIIEKGKSFQLVKLERNSYSEI